MEQQHLDFYNYGGMERGTIAKLLFVLIFVCFKFGSIHSFEDLFVHLHFLFKIYVTHDG